MAQNTLSLKVTKSQKQVVQDLLLGAGWKEEIPPNEYVEVKMRGNGGVVLIYTSGKLVAQGSGDFSFIEESLTGTKKMNTDFRPHIGTDEVGKGDYFGPMVLGAAYVDSESALKLEEIGVGDSKKFSDSKIEIMASEIKKVIPYSTLVFTPSQYNETYPEYGNVSPMLADLHAKVAEELLEQLKKGRVECSHVVVDQFSKNVKRLENAFGKMKYDITLEQFHKGESDIAVAAGSILARAKFLEEWRKMEEEHGMKFPKGASSVIGAGKDFVSKYGADDLRKVAKTSFRTTSQVLSLF